MSGHPLKAPSDASKFRQQYMATLALQANINDSNLQANKIYKRTGQTPTQPTDMRLTSEKLADIARLRIEVRAQLGGIMDGQDANNVSNDLSPETLQFVAQNINPIVKDVKEKYKLGMPAAVFENYINSYMLKSGQVNEVAYGLQQQADPIIGAQQIREVVNDEMLNFILELLRSRVVNPYLSRGLERNIEVLQEDILPLIEYLTPIGEIPDLEVRHMFQDYLNVIFNKIATITSIQSDLIKLENAVLGRDPYMADIYANILNNKLAVQPSDIKEAKQVKLMLEDVKKDKPIQAEELGGAEGSPPQKKIVKEEVPLSKKQQIAEFEKKYGRPIQSIQPVDIAKNKQDLRKVINEMILMSSSGRMSDTKYYKNVMAEKPHNSNGPLLAYELDRVFDHLKQDLTRIKESTLSEADLPPASPLPSLGDIDTATVEYGKKPLKYAGEPISVKQGKGLSRPRVITKPLGRPPFQADIDYSEGVLPITRLIPFGSLFIDRDKLGRGIVSLRRGKGAYLPSTVKTRRVSSNLNDIIKAICGGGSPTFTQLSKLDDDERRYLHQLGKTASLLDRIDIPAPTKEEDDKDIHQFEVMKGEISSGNDSVELVKKFKALIIKMINKGLLPKAQGKDMLLGLVELGY
jgi:hypothetical protein